MFYLLANSECKCFTFILEHIRYILLKNNISVTIMQNYNPNDDHGEDIWIVIWNALLILPKKCIIYNFDPFIPKVQDMFIQLLVKSPDTKIIKFIDYCYGNNYRFLKTLMLPYEVIPYGYSSYYEHLKNIHLPEYPPKKIDVLFYGNVNGRRKDVLNTVKNFCNNNSYKLVIRNNNLFDIAERISLISQSKIVISISSADAKTMQTNDLARIAQIISMKEFVITEYIGDTKVENTMSKYVLHYNTVPELLEYIKKYLSNENDRIDMINKAYDSFKQDFNFEKELLNAIDI